MREFVIMPNAVLVGRGVSEQASHSVTPARTHTPHTHTHTHTLQKGRLVFERNHHYPLLSCHKSVAIEFQTHGKFEGMKSVALVCHFQST